MHWECSVTFINECSVTFINECSVTFINECSVTFIIECSVTFINEFSVTFINECSVTFINECSLTFINECSVTLTNECSVKMNYTWTFKFLKQKRILSVFLLLYQEWAVHTGRYTHGSDSPDYPTWKTRFRNALNKLPDIQELKEQNQLDGNEPFRIYQLLQRNGRYRKCTLFFMFLDRKVGFMDVKKISVDADMCRK